VRAAITECIEIPASNGEFVNETFDKQNDDEVLQSSITESYTNDKTVQPEGISSSADYADVKKKRKTETTKTVGWLELVRHRRHIACCFVG
jgi:hypothetical protein